jgi:hypothetical protein
MRNLLLCSIVLAGCGTAAATAPDKTKLPLGNQKTSTTPKQGYLWSCQQSFNPNAPGPQAEGPWINGDTWDMTEKIAVGGSVTRAAVSKVTVAGGKRTITGNGLPSVSGTFPIAASDPAYRYDRNPNSIRAQSISVSVPANPKRAATATCVGGSVGVTTKGIPIFNAFDAGGRDAVANEVQDRCGGHPQQAGQYHFHGFSACAKRTGLWGYAYDGFGIYGPKDQQTGKVLSTQDLDACHGITSTVKWKGKWKRIYHYVATDDFPYTVGCYRGTPRMTSTL